MESRFAHLRQRDSSVSMMRVKMSRRRSQSQKENRERTVNSRRQLDNLPELELSSMDASIAMGNMSVVQEKTVNNTKPAKSVAADERLKQLERWKERKALEKEKEKREKERKGVFKTGVYHPKSNAIAAALPAASSRARETRVTPAASLTTRVTRSMKQQQQVKPLKVQHLNTVATKAVPTGEQPTRSRVAPVKAVPTKTKGKACPVEPIRALPTRSASAVQQDKIKNNPAGGRATRSKAAVNKDNKETEKIDVPPAVFKEPEPKKQPENESHPPSPVTHSETEDNIQPDSVPTGNPAEGPSFAPQGFVFQAPSGLSSFKFEPPAPCLNNTSFKPSMNFSFPAAPGTNVHHQEEPSQASPSKSPRRSPPRTPSAGAPPTPASSTEAKHDVLYFRSQIANETERLTSLCGHWEAKVEVESIPEEMRDRMRTAVGQARLLMKERFNQFGGLVDDCEFARGEKVTTCTDLQGFWDMVYFQVEDVNKKFEALSDAEGRGWTEERKPPPRQKKVVKKPASAGPPAKPAGATAAAAARSRLAAAKAAMKAKQLAAEKAAMVDAAIGVEETFSPDAQEPRPQGASLPGSSVSPDEGFSLVDSPLKAPASVRKSSRLSAAALPQSSPSSMSLATRRVTRQSLASAQTLGQSAAALLHTPTEQVFPPRKTPAKAQKSQPGTPQPTRSPKPTSSPPSVAVTSVVSPHDTPAAVCQAPGTSVCLSFTLSPCETATRATVESAGPAGHSAESSVVEDMPGLDFERYLQPSLRCSLSPAEEVAMETLSPMATPASMAPDVEMESPKGQSESQAQQEMEPPEMPLLSALPSPKSQAADAAVLLFTPDLKDRIRQSVCPSDLMVFTPPL